MEEETTWQPIQQTTKSEMVWISDGNMVWKAVKRVGVTFRTPEGFAIDVDALKFERPRDPDWYPAPPDDPEVEV